MQCISWQDAPERCYVIGPYLPPIAKVSPGETFIVETLDAFGNRVSGPDTPPTSQIPPHLPTQAEGDYLEIWAIVKALCGHRWKPSSQGRER